MHRFASIATRSCAAGLPRTTDFGCKRPTFYNGYYRAFTKPHVSCRDRVSNASRPTGIVNADWLKDRLDTFDNWRRVDLWEAKLPRHRGDRPARGATSESGVARHPIQAYQVCDDAVLPKYLSLPVRSFLDEFQHALGIPDAAHGTVVSVELERRGATSSR